MSYQEDIININKIELEDSGCNLCLKCGMCCKLITSEFNFSELVLMAENKNEQAEEFLKHFEPYTSEKELLDKAGNFYSLIKQKNIFRSNFTRETSIFFYCKNLNDNNTCSVYNSRPQYCRQYPETPWTLIPENCGYHGYQFEQKEIIKRFIRQLKELLEELNTHEDSDIVTDDKQTAGELKEKILNKIEPWEKFGAKDW